MDTDTLVTTFMSVTGTEDDSVAKQYLDITNNDLEYAVTLYMESHPPQAAASVNDTNNIPHSHGDDELLAQRLQQEAYQDQDNVRAADANIHRHETLVDSFDTGFTGMPRTQRPTDIFGQGRVGIFNQRFDDDENEYYHNRIEEVDDDDSYSEENEDDDSDDEVMELNDNGEVVETVKRSRRRINRDNRLNELTSTQRRLANLFRPPFDIMSKIDIDTAKVQGRQEKKWILINIQDSSEFVCQVLNRDFWSNAQVKRAVKENFIFLQYQHDSPNGLNFINFYSVDKFPHVAILDPLTGERVHKWTDGEVPNVDEWLTDIDLFLKKFSLLPNSNNPVVKHEVKFDPDALTEDQQIEYALKQSMAGGSSVGDAINIDDEQEEEPSEPVPEPEDTFDGIKPLDHEEPTSGVTTRIQIRFPNGKRLIHKFDVDSDKVESLYQWLKYILIQANESEYGLSFGERFVLSNASNRAVKLIDSVGQTIGEAGLKNASILLEKE